MALKLLRFLNNKTIMSQRDALALKWWRKTAELIQPERQRETQTRGGYKLKNIFINILNYLIKIFLYNKIESLSLVYFILKKMNNISITCYDWKN